MAKRGRPCTESQPLSVRHVLRLTPRDQERAEKLARERGVSVGRMLRFLVRQGMRLLDAFGD